MIWTELESVMLSKISQAKKHKHHMTSHSCMEHETVDLIQVESGTVVTRGWRE
jgi:hypothetical protein